VSAHTFIEAEKAESRNVAKACELMEVSWSAYYHWQRHEPSRREIDDQALGERSAASTDFRALLEAHHGVQSLSRKGQCWDHAVGESWFATREEDLIHRHS